MTPKNTKNLEDDRENSGDRNSGNRNSGDQNSGNRNSGNLNSGNRNSGNRNSGYLNSGNRNSGNRNSGNRNSGNLNSGDQNSGNRNSGYLNSGDRNSGNRNSGNRNSGNLNSGNRNSGNRNSGYLNSGNRKQGLLFDKSCDLWDDNGDCIIIFPNWFYYTIMSSNNTDNPCLWIPLSEMTNEEKEANVGCEVVGGYIKKGLVSKNMKDHRRRSFDDSKDLEDIKKTLSLPNFDYSIFEEITGISKEDFDKKLGVVSDSLEGKEVEITIDGKTYKAVIK